LVYLTRTTSALGPEGSKIKTSKVCEDIGGPNIGSIVSETTSSTTTTSYRVVIVGNARVSWPKGRLPSLEKFKMDIDIRVIR
jgi:hypothetical protein